MGWGNAAGLANRRTEQGEKDLVMLERLIEDHDHELHEDERAAFREMHQWIRGAPSRSMSPNQREWARKALDRVGAGEYENLVSSGRVAPSTSGATFGFETMPRPLKPPGRK
jgi:hypothetical protein